MKGTKKLLKRYGGVICSFAMAVATLASQSCRLRLYEPEEPKALREFIKQKD
ncbi:MAG: cyclic lactone autoinducer peptide [Wujia sp.]